ncbi:MAG TPA: tRNA pseudouridine(13) synthase TruD, partial [Planctomycetes bacterium]|nr:tRNA pseudouridine(13) synthase TruD [Planctomycetota bacterium]
MTRPRATVKIKCTPDDFLVEELTGVVPGREGAFALYRLTKTGLGTMEAAERIARAWDIG